jgi:glutathione S-transferase
MSKYTVTYFDIPALAEPMRAMMAIGKMDWEDERLKMGPDGPWPALKPTTKWGQMPLMKTPTGKEMTQTKSMSRYLAKKVSVGGKPLYPEDHDEAFDVDEIIDAFEDVRMKMVPTFQIKDQAEKEAARAALFKEGGEVHRLLNQLEKFAQDGGTMVCGRTTVADVWAYWYLNFCRCGFWDGIPTDFLGSYPKLSAVVAKVAAIPELKAYYGGIAEKNPMYKCFVA